MPRPTNFTDLAPVGPDEEKVNELLLALSWIAEHGESFVAERDADLPTYGDDVMYSRPSADSSWLPEAPPPDLKLSLKDWRYLARMLCAYFEIDLRLAPKSLPDVVK